MPVLFALWPYQNGHPHPESNDPWGETSAALCLTDYHPEDCGTFLTVTYTEDGDTCRLVYSGDVAPLLIRYAETVAEETGHPAFTGPAIDRAREAFGVAVELGTREVAHEACYQWCEPDPDTSRSIRKMSSSTREAIAHGSEREAANDEGERFDRFLCEALGIDAETGTLGIASLAA